MGTALRMPAAPLRLEFLLVALLSASAFADAVPDGGHTTVAPAAVLINEVSPMPLSDHEPTWVELLNVSEHPVSLSGWSLWDRWGCRFVFPDDTPELAPAGLLVLWCQRTAEAPYGRIFMRDEGVHIDGTGDEFADAFRGHVNECALFASDQPDPQALVDFVCWTYEPEAASAATVQAAGLPDVLLRPVAAVPQPGRHSAHAGPVAPNPFLRVRRLRAGDAIGRSPLLNTMLAPGSRIPIGDLRDTWDVYAAADVTPGKCNSWPAPGTGPARTDIAPHVVVFAVTQPPTLRGPSRPVRIQMAQRPGFENCLLDRLFAGDEEMSVDNVEWADYYWRARIEDGDPTTPWSRGQYLGVYDIGPFGHYKGR